MHSPENTVPEEIQPPPMEESPEQLSEAALADQSAVLLSESSLPDERSKLVKTLSWTFRGSQGLRGGWSVLIFALLFALFAYCIGFVFSHLRPAERHSDFSASAQFFGEMIAFLAMVGAATLVALIERRPNLLAFNLDGPRRSLHFVSGLGAGFAALSVLVGGLALGGWLRFGPVALSGAGVFKFAALWAACFLLVGFVEEGLFRCYLQFTLARSINFWWALALVALLCGDLLWKGKGNGIWGVYLIAGLIAIPCTLLHLSQKPGSSFWQAAWVTSTLFGFVHTGNNGENWIGIFAAGLIGFVFCVSIWATGSAWWAIGCHAAWDWSETFFYGTPDSGLVAQGHLLTTKLAGSVLWSGGADGPEGSLLVLPVILLLLALLLAVYGRKRRAEATIDSEPVQSLEQIPAQSEAVRVE